LKRIRDGVSKVVLAVNSLGLLACFVMVFVVAIDVILRKVSGNAVSIKGSNEFSSYFLIVICMLGIPALQVKDGHVWVNMIVNKMPYRVRCFYHGFILLLEAVVVGMLTYGGWMKVQSYIGVGRTDVLNMPKWPFALICLIGFAEFFILLLIDTIQLFMDGSKNEEKPEPHDGWSESDVKGI